MPLHPPLPPVWAQEACRHLQAGVKRPRRRSGRLWAWRPAIFRTRAGSHSRPAVKRLARRTRRFLASVGYVWMARVLDGFTWNGAEHLDQATADSSRLWPDTDELEAIFQLVEGRLLSELEVLQRTERAGIDPDASVEDCLTALTLLGRVRCRPGLARTGFGGWRCQRCGETENIEAADCAACGEAHCPLCEQCRSLGVVRGCTLLYSGVVSEGMHRSTGTVLATVPFKSHELTAAQARAADRLAQFVVSDRRKEALVWAVCGAGKTELCFPAVSRVLASGGRVLFAIPRRDIVRELGQRLRGAFFTVDAEVLHGGEGRVERSGMGPGTLTVATTHQVLRFERAFDLAIVDEVDAFPYRGSPMLRRAVASAVRPGGRIVYMSATPGRSLVKRADAGDSFLVTVPVRHHGRPMPVPTLHRDGSCRKDARVDMPRVLPNLIKRSLTANRPARVLVFVPDVASTERVGRALLRRNNGRTGVPQSSGGKGIRVLWSYANDPERNRKLKALQQGDCDVFVATTILERGVTVPDVDVIVAYADEERVFSEAALVQMAGRVGRSVDRPTGRVHFVGARVSRSMKEAVQQIERMNAEAARLGLLREEAPVERGAST